MRAQRKILLLLNFLESMAEHSRYNSNAEQEVLANKLGIVDQQALNEAEAILLPDAYNYFLGRLETEKLKFNVKLIFEIHKYFLGTLYAWVGKARTVEISKGGTLFCASLQIPNELKKFDEILKKNLPMSSDERKVVSEKLAIIHCEFNAIHPFREGNGRTIRLFLDLLALNVGFNMIDYSKSSQDAYIQACIAGMQKDYSKMKKVIVKGLKKLVS